MNHFDVSIFDTGSNTIESVATKPFYGRYEINQAIMSRDGEVIALVEDFTKAHLKAVSITKDKHTITVRMIEDFGSFYD